jgi:hypothetical protein
MKLTKNKMVKAAGVFLGMVIIPGPVIIPLIGYLI